MEIDFQTIFYILAGLAYLYTRGKKNNKKPAGQQIPENDTPPPAFDWEKTLRDLLGEEEEVEQPAAEPPKAPASVETRGEIPVETYEEKARKRTVLKDYDEELIRKASTVDYDEEVISRHAVRNYEEEALKRTEARNLEQNLKKEKQRPVLELYEEAYTPAFELQLEGDELKKALVYAEILAPRHF